MNTRADPPPRSCLCACRAVVTSGDCQRVAVTRGRSTGTGRRWGVRGWGGQAVAAHHRRGVALGDAPHGDNFVLRRPLGEGPPEVVAVDHDHAVTPASPQQLRADQERHIKFIARLVHAHPALLACGSCSCCCSALSQQQLLQCSAPAYVIEGCTESGSSCCNMMYRRPCMPCVRGALRTALPWLWCESQLRNEASPSSEGSRAQYSWCLGPGAACLAAV